MSLKTLYKRGEVFENAKHLLFQKAKQLKKTMTGAEKILWMEIKGGISGLKFRRQHPIGNYIADFCCHNAKLVTETDGSIHKFEEVRELDAIKQKEFENLDYCIVRFTNKEVQFNIEKVLDTIKEIICKLINLQNQNASSLKGV